VADIIAPTSCALHRTPAAISQKANYLRERGLMERPVRPITPDWKDFDAVKADYCRKHQIDEAQLSAWFKADDQLAAELYQRAIAFKTARLRTFRAAQDVDGHGMPGHREALRECNRGGTVSR
jgi:hypothetical protein